MNIEQIKADLRQRLSARRFLHTEGVAASAKKLAEVYGVDPDRAELAGWIHDCAKELPLAEMQALISEKQIPIDDAVMRSRSLLHGPAGSIYAEKYYDISDAEIQSAVFYHTTGRPDMSLMEKIIFLADYIEPSRDFPGVELIRELAFTDLTAALIEAYDSTIRHLIDQKAYIYDLTFMGRNALVTQMKMTAKK